MEQLYPETWEKTSDLPGGYQRYWVPHMRRTLAEIQVLTLARRHTLHCAARHNRSKDTHALILTNRCAITLSHTSAPSVPPRWAQFRADYSAAANYTLPLPEFGIDSPPALVRVDDPRVDVVISHGYKYRDWRELGFVWANFLDTGAMRYTGRGLDLRAIADGLKPSSSGIEQIQEPDFQPPQIDEQEQGNA